MTISLLSPLQLPMDSKIDRGFSKPFPLPIEISGAGEKARVGWGEKRISKGFNPIGVLIDIVKRMLPPEPLTLGMLELTVTMGKWDTEILEQSDLLDSLLGFAPMPKCRNEKEFGRL